ncbi:N-acetylmuramoyl-L-alanine amidase family protein, partial [Bacillus paralicheniformis]|uniref:N-acetylmuramoyl-L-alanine amidase family protein n=1 Tax=Bacillus paralicheniformis TaxID=1648923 RepID=UPI0028997B3B
MIILDPGHGGKDPGTVKGSVSEKSITLKVSTQVKQLLENAGAKVYMTRTGDT